MEFLLAGCSSSTRQLEFPIHASHCCVLRFAFCVVAAAGSLRKEPMNREKELCDARCADGRVREKERQEKPNGSEESVSSFEKRTRKRNGSVKRHEQLTPNEADPGLNGL